MGHRYVSVPRIAGWLKCSNTPDTNYEDIKFIITHPFHPLYNQEFYLVTHRHNWGEDQIYFHDLNQHLVSVPASWTSVIPVDPFIKVADGRSFFRPEDLVRLCNLTEALKSNLKTVPGSENM
jgi:hypothetical protein